VSKTLAGWLAIRNYRSAEKALTHLDHIMPILFPSPETALAAAELCYPRPHPALCWNGEVPECMTDPDAEGDYALGKIGWERSLRHDAWLFLALVWNGQQVSPGSELDDALNTTLRVWTNPSGIVH
jgi:hypothetical protein